MLSSIYKTSLASSHTRMPRLMLGHCTLRQFIYLDTNFLLDSFSQYSVAAAAGVVHVIAISVAFHNNALVIIDI